MTAERNSTLRVALIVAGAACLALGPLMLVWPAGWRWTPHQAHYEQMMVGVYLTLGVFLIRASKDPLQNRSLIWFAVWSSVVHASIMMLQALADSEHRGHLLGDVPAVFLVAGVLTLLMRRERSAPSLPAPSGSARG
jgi:hypothetical protein